MKPTRRPQRPEFSSGPCAKRPGWSLDALEGRRARPLAPREGRQGSPEGGDRPQPRAARHARRIAARHRARLGHGRDRDGDVVAARPARVDVLAWESFGQGWVTDVTEQLAPGRARARGRLRRAAGSRRGRLRRATWSSPGTARPRACASRTATGFPRTRGGLTLCDATSAVFAMELPVGEARRRHLVVAEGARRRGRARHARALAARARAPRELHAAVAAARRSSA